MMLDPRTPVLIGAGQISVHVDDLDDARSPIELMAEVCRRAGNDAGLSALTNPDRLAVVSTLSYRSANPARVLADALGITPRSTALTTMGGNAPQHLVNHTARAIQNGTLDLALLAGGEARRSQRRARAANRKLWPDDDNPAPPDVIIGEEFVLSSPQERARNIWMPVQLYPIFESALRAEAGRSLQEHTDFLAELWSRFAAVAATNPHAWIQRAPSAAEIATVSLANRMIGVPYPKLMNSNNDVDQAAALVLCSAEKAMALGVPKDRWIFPLGGADCHEHPFVSQRWSLTDTPAIRAAGDLALELSGRAHDDLSLIDLYSCFPSAVQLGARSLGLDLDRQLTRTGGLSFAGGPWNNYSMHAIATMTNELRDDPSTTGLVWANGGFTTKHSVGIYGGRPNDRGFRWASPQADIDRLPQRTLASEHDAAGSVIIEAYTVMHDRDSQPERVIASALLADGRRAWATSERPDIAVAMTVGEWVGAEVQLTATGELVA